METINYLGKYESLDALWAAHPTGGIEGDYARIADDYYGWDKYLNNWVKTELSVEEEPEKSEPVKTDALSAVNYLGDYESMSAVWKKIPEGGHEGDYLSISGVCYLWDSSKRNWVIDDTKEVTPPEGAGSQTGSTNTQLNFLGKFASIADVWYFYPEGGHLGDFLLSKDIYYIWDAATTNWVDSSDSEYVDYDFSGEAEKAIETRTTINYLGSFEELNDVWIIYPEGGHEGDYIHLKEVITIWNKYRRQWGEDSSPATPAIKTDKIDGSLTINHDLTVSGIAYLPSIVTDITKLGLFGLSLYLNGSLIGKYNPAQEDTEFYLDGIATKDELGSEVNKINLTIQQTDSELRTLISSISGSSHNHSNLSVLNKITDAKLTNWDTAFSWGNHANAGYLKSISSEQIVAAIPAMYLGKTQVQYEAKAQDLTGISSLMLEKSTSKLAYDSANDAWKLTGNLLVTGFITAGAKGHSGSGEGGESYTQYEWSEIKSMTETGMGLLASAFSVKEAYDDVSTSVNSINSTVANIRSLIPNAATSSNQLADKNFVNSSIASNTAVFRGTFETLSDLPTQNVKTNDYAFVIISVDGNPEYQRYKFNGTSWVFEYTLNNSSFTAEQWSAINSGITTTKVGNYDAHLINYSNPHKVTKSQVGLGNVENVALSSWAGSNKITTLGTITTGVWNGSKIGNDYLANSSITIGTTAISLGSTAKSLAGIEKLQLNDANSNLAYDSTTGSWKLTGNLLVTGFISAGAKGNSSSGGGSTYTQREWAEIKIMSASEIGLLASAYSVKEAYDELNAAIETLAGKATNVKFTQTITSGKQIGTLAIDGEKTILYAPASYAWGEITGKPSFATVATSGKYSDLSGVPTKVSEFTNDAGYLTTHQTVTLASGTNNGTLKLTVGSTTTDNIAVKGLGSAAYTSSSAYAAASHTHTFASLTSKPTTIAGYGITDAKIANGVITLGANTITPLTAHQTIYTLTIQKNGTNVGSYTPNSKAATVNISDVASATTLGNHLKDTTLHLSSDEHTHLTKLLDALDVDDSGDVFVVGGKGFYTSGFISAGKKGTSGGEGSNYTQKEWADIKAMTSAPTENGILASAYSVKEAYDDIKSSVTANSRNITSLAGRVTTLEGKATAVSFSQTLTSGTKIGAITVDGTTTNIYAPTLASQMGSTAIGGTSSYLYWNGSAWATKALGSNAFTSISKVSQLTNDSGYITGITKAMVEGVLTGNITSHTHSYLPLAGGTMSNTDVVTNLNADFLDGRHAASFYQQKSLRSDQNSIYDLRFNYGTYDKGDYGGTYNGEYPTNYGAYLALTYNDKNIGALMFFDAPTSNVLGHIYVRTRGAGDNNTTYSEWGTLAYLTDNVASSSKWATPRTITLTGSVTGSVSIDGSQNVSLATTTNHTHTFDSLTSKPTTISGYGIMDAYTKTQTDTKLSGYLPLSGGTITSEEMAPLALKSTSSSGHIILQFISGGTYLGALGFKGKNDPYFRMTDGAFNTLLHSGNYNSYALPLSGGTLTGSVTMQGMDTNLIRNITYTGTSSWARALINLQVDGISKFSISAFGDYTLGASDNGIKFAYIGCNSYDGLNLRISATSLSWGDSPILHSGNVGNYALKLDGSNAMTRGINWNNASVGTNVDAFGEGLIVGKTTDSGTTLDSLGYKYASVLNVSNGVYRFQIASAASNANKLLYRGYDANAKTYFDWKTIAFTDSNISGNAATATNADKLDGVHYQNILERYYSGYASSGTATGWFRIAETLINNGAGITFLLAIQRSFSHTNNESYLFSISISYWGGISITQLSGYANTRLITKIRVDWANGQIAYIDLYIDSSTTNNNYYWYTVGCAKSYTTWTANPTLAGTAYEFTTVQGCKSDRGFTGDLTGTASKATDADKLDGYHKNDILRKTYNPTSTISLNDVVARGIDFTDWDYAHSVNVNNQPGGNGASSAASVVSFGTDYPFQIYSDYNNTSYLYYRSFYSNTGWKAWRQFAFIDSNVASATKLLNSRTLWGQSFDGTGNVSGAPSFPSIIDINRNVDTGVMIDSSKIGFEIETFANDVRLKTYSASGVANPTHLVLTSSGNVGIGTTTPSYKLHIVGALYSSAGLITDGAISAAKTSTSSDIRLKDNISEIGSKTALQWLLMLKPKSWTWNSLAGVKGRSMGFVAQDVEGILPQMVKKQDNGYLSLDYTQLHALEVSALQSHEKRIEELERENKILKEELNKLKLNAN